MILKMNSNLSLVINNIETCSTTGRIMVVTHQPKEMVLIEWLTILVVDYPSNTIISLRPQCLLRRRLINKIMKIFSINRQIWISNTTKVRIKIQMFGIHQHHRKRFKKIGIGALKSVEWVVNSNNLQQGILHKLLINPILKTIKEHMTSLGWLQKKWKKSQKLTMSLCMEIPWAQTQS